MKYLLSYQSLNENTIPDDIKSILQDILDEYTDSLNGNISYDITLSHPTPWGSRRAMWRGMPSSSRSVPTNEFAIQFKYDANQRPNNPLFIDTLDLDVKAYNLSKKLSPNLLHGEVVKKLKDEIIGNLKNLELPQRIFKLTEYELIDFECFPISGNRDSPVLSLLFINQ